MERGRREGKEDCELLTYDRPMPRKGGEKAFFSTSLRLKATEGRRGRTAAL